MPIIKYICQECEHQERLRVDSDLIPDDIICSECGAVSSRNLKRNFLASSNVQEKPDNKDRDFQIRLKNREADLEEAVETGKYTSEQVDKFKQLSKIITGGQF